MKILKFLLIAIMAVSISGKAYAQLSAANGLAAGTSLLSLYSQYKADGKLDLTNTKNITNIISLITNIKGLTGGSTAENTSTDFISNLISGSKNLVTESNTNSVLGTLGSIANLDTKSLTSSTVTGAVTGAVTSAIGGLLGKKKNNTGDNTSSSASTAASALTSLFATLQ